MMDQQRPTRTTQAIESQAFQVNMIPGACSGSPTQCGKCNKHEYNESVGSEAGIPS